jgi:regulator of protease activity HflC (stomatin/prohibitin superfamily)
MSLFLTVLFAIIAFFVKPVTKILEVTYSWWYTAVPTALAAVFFITATMNVVAPGTNQVQTLYGSVKPQPLEAGFHFVNPLANFITYDLRQSKEDINDITLQTQDRLTSDIDVSIIYQAVAASTPTTYVDSGTLPQAVEKHMIPAIRSIIREVGRSVPLAQNLANAEVQQRLQTEIETKLNEYLSAKGFKVFDVLIRDVNLPNVVKQAVVATKEREEQIEREKATLKVIEQQAQQQVVQAEAKAKAAEQQAIAIETLAKAEAFRILTEAEATAKGNDLVNKSLTKDLINYAEANKWDGKLPTTMIPNSATPIIGVK